MVLYVFLVFYIFGNFKITFWFETVIKLLAVSVVFLGLLGIIQWYLQGSLFNSYMFFGEQPYSASTRGIAIENVLGAAYIPSYGTFRHPNVFAGFLSIVLIWLFAYVQYNMRLFIPLLLGVFALFFTFSQIAWIAFALGLLFLLVKNLDRRTYLPAFLVFLFVLIGLLLPWLNFKSLEQHPSFYRRANLIQGTYKVIQENVFFGTGPNTNTLVIEKYSPVSRDLRFVQPVHNMFLLLLSETGVFTLALFTVILALAMTRKVSLLFFVSLTQFIILGSFDHYLLTIPQMQILFWLTLGFSLTYNSIDYV
jgi:hypothetical protein